MSENKAWVSGQPSIRYRIIVGVWLALFVTMLASNYSGWRLLGSLDKAAAILLGMVGYLLVVVFRRKGATKCPWTVAVIDGDIRTSDGQSAERIMPISALQRVVVATDDSGPWGNDVVFLLYDSAQQEPIGIFPLEATGSQDFIGWLSKQPGYQDKELAKAMGSTSVDQFEVYPAPQPA